MTKEKKSEVYIVDQYQEEDKIDERMQEIYGITLDAFIEMYKERKGKCDICEEVSDINDTVIDLHEATLTSIPGKVIRGLLCIHCKNGIMAFSYDSANMSIAAKYVRAALQWNKDTGMTIQHVQDNHAMMEKHAEKEQDKMNNE